MQPGTSHASTPGSTSRKRDHQGQLKGNSPGEKSDQSSDSEEQSPGLQTVTRDPNTLSKEQQEKGFPFLVNINPAAIQYTLCPSLQHAVRQAQLVNDRSRELSPKTDLIVRAAQIYCVLTRRVIGLVVQPWKDLFTIQGEIVQYASERGGQWIDPHPSSHRTGVLIVGSLGPPRLGFLTLWPDSVEIGQIEPRQAPVVLGLLKYCRTCNMKVAIHCYHGVVNIGPWLHNAPTNRDFLNLL